MPFEKNQRGIGIPILCANTIIPATNKNKPVYTLLLCCTCGCIKIILIVLFKLIKQNYH